MSHVLAGYRLPIGLFRFRIVPLEPLLVPVVNKGNMLRGGFGHAFRRMCCIPLCRDTHTCPLAASCPYKAVFEPSPPAGAESLSKNQDIPRPFVFRAPQTLQTRFEKGEKFEFDVVLIGRALRFLPYFVLSFRELAAEGLGLNRAKCDLERVEQLNHSAHVASTTDRGALVYSAEDQLFRRTEPITAEDWIKNRLNNVAIETQDDGYPLLIRQRRKQNASEVSGGVAVGTEATPVIPVAAVMETIAVHRIALRFLTPTLLRADAEVIRHPDFHHVFKRLRDRVNTLSTFFGDGPLQVDFYALGKRAEAVRTSASNVHWTERFRTSSKTRQRHELSGFVGEVVYEGNLDEFLPWLAIGELLHVGRHTAWGNGCYRVQRTG
jgi:hypothetical protein